MLILAIVILIVVILIVLLVGCILYLVKQKKTPNSEAGAAVRMSAITTPASHTTRAEARVTELHPSTQREETPYSTPQVTYAPEPKDPLLPPPVYSG